MTSNELIQLIEDAGYDAQSYSGRGMYGTECVGVTCDDPTRFAMDLIDELDIDEESGNLYELTKVIRSAHTDSMGLSQIVYFPRYAWPE